MSTRLGSLESPIETRRGFTVRVALSNGRHESLFTRRTPWSGRGRGVTSRTCPLAIRNATVAARWSQQETGGAWEQHARDQMLSDESPVL
jgi:hypothetical protein